MDVLDPFRHAWVLALLVVPIALIVWTWRRGGHPVVVPFDHARARASGWRFALRAAESLPALLLALVIVILAGPQRWDEPKTRRVLTNIEFCVDVSGSMTAKFGEGDRYDAAMQAINDFLDRRAGDAFGLTFFGNNVLHWVPLTTDISAFRCAPPFMKPGNLPYWFGGTEIGKALLACRTVLLEREQGDRMIVLITDGYSADLGGGREDEIAQKLRADGITVFTVHVAEGGIPDEVVKIAAITGGEAFSAGDPGGLAHVFERIDGMQKTKLEKTHAEATDDFLLYALGGLGLLALGLFAAFGLRYTPW
ncbi:MAG: VWA domain-containing protein [Planctomycetes bacterium]|nr:VWA domain-containing protein [Planctomycetota bacterium]